MNLHALALALRPPVTAGDVVRVSLIKAGKEPGQAVGYLDDGTMVVAERSREPDRPGGVGGRHERAHHGQRPHGLQQAAGVMSTGRERLPVLDGVGCVVVAAGQGTRLAAGRPKAFVELAGTTLLEHAVSRVLDAGVHHVVAVVPADLVDLDPRAAAGRATVVAGGVERQDSVALGLVGAARHRRRRAGARRRPVPGSAVLRGVRGAGGRARARRPSSRGCPSSTPSRRWTRDGTVVGHGVARAAARHPDAPGVHAGGAGAGPRHRRRRRDGRRRAGRAPRRAGHRGAGDPMAFKITTPDDLALAEFWLARVEP